MVVVVSSAPAAPCRLLTVDVLVVFLSLEFQEPKGWWTGGSFISRSRRWTWTSGQSIYQPINFARWASGQPPASMTTTHCIVLFRPAKYYWHAAPCSDRHNFICQLNSAWQEWSGTKRKEDEAEIRWKKDQKPDKIQIIGPLHLKQFNFCRLVFLFVLYWKCATDYWITSFIYLNLISPLINQSTIYWNDGLMIILT